MFMHNSYFNAKCDDLFCFTDIEQNGIDFSRQVRTNFALPNIHHTSGVLVHHTILVFGAAHCSSHEVKLFGGSSENGLKDYKSFLVLEYVSHYE